MFPCGYIKTFHLIQTTAFCGRQAVSETDVHKIISKYKHCYLDSYLYVRKLYFIFDFVFLCVAIFLCSLFVITVFRIL